MEDKFQGHFIRWREVRINKLISILGKDWFKGKSILELACGYGHIGKSLKELGAIVTQTEGNPEYAKVAEAIVLDQDKEWDLKREFDLVIHWGILQHLDNWRRDLQTAIRHGRIITLDTECVDFDDPMAEIKVNENWYDGAMNKIGTRASVAAIEKCIADLGCTFKRYDDSGLDVEYHKYSWKEGEYKNDWKSTLRRFWMIYK